MKNEVVFDSSFLLPIFSKDLRNEPSEKYCDRINYCFEQLEKEKTKIIIPTPALSEFLVRAGQAGQEYLKMIRSKSVFRIVPFKANAAVEVAQMDRKAIEQGDKKSGSKEPWQRIKIDRQIIAIAKVSDAEAIYSNDKDLRKFAEQIGLKAIAPEDLPLPKEPWLL